MHIKNSPSSLCHFYQIEGGLQGMLHSHVYWMFISSVMTVAYTSCTRGKDPEARSKCLL